MKKVKGITALLLAGSVWTMSFSAYAQMPEADGTVSDMEYIGSAATTEEPVQEWEDEYEQLPLPFEEVAEDNTSARFIVKYRNAQAALSDTAIEDISSGYSVKSVQSVELS